MPQTIYVKDEKRFNIFAPATINGIQYANFLNADIRFGLGIKELELESPPEECKKFPEFYFINEFDEAPYISYTRRSEAQIQEILYKRYEATLDEYLDSVAQSYGFGDRTRLALRAGYPGSRQKLGSAFGTWMDNCNDLAKQLYLDVKDGKVALPTQEEFLALLPKFEFLEG